MKSTQTKPNNNNYYDHYDNLKSCNKVYSEVDGMGCLLNYRAYNAGFCKILTHPRWGSAVYPATIFCHAPRDTIIKMLSPHYISSIANS